MDEVRCPMCGKSNPAEAEICLFCQARLKPLIISQAASEGGQDMPDWLRNLRGAVEPEEEQPADAEGYADALDWFASPEEREAVVPPAPALDSPEGEEPVDWLANPDNLEELLPETVKDEPSATAEAVSTSSEDLNSLTEWLASLKHEETAAEEQTRRDEEETLLPEETILTSPIEPTDSDEEISFSKWLASPKIEEPSGADWSIGDQSEAQPPENTETPEVGKPAEPGELPDWLTELAGNVPEAIQEPIAMEPEEILVANQEPADVEIEEPSSIEPEPVEPIAAAPQAEAAQELPDWLTQIDQTQETMAGSVPAFTPDEGLEQLEPAELAALEEATAKALSVPDWISDLTAETPAEAPGIDRVPEGEAGLAQANLPDWLEAMRPVESVAPETAFLDQTDDHMESAGPLAGLRGVIPGESWILEQHTPPAYSLKIPISDDQQARLATLEELVNSEGQGKPLPARAAQTNQLVLRLVVFGLLVLVSIIALWVGSQTPLPTAEQIAPEVRSVQQHVDSLLPNQPTLFVLDYEPGYFDEMGTVVKPVLDHLVMRGVHLAFVSTSTTGPIIATNLVNWIDRQPAFANSEFTNYTNLGYLPGGTNGIRAFAQAPAETLPTKLDGTPAWTGPLANTQQGLGQFALVVVACDDPEGARQWIEQLGPLLQDTTPLILLTSAQAGPTVLPYYAYQSGLVSGLVSGMAGGADYYSATFRVSTVPLYWDAFSLALNGVVVFIVLGVFVSLISSSITRRKAQKGEENT